MRGLGCVLMKYGKFIACESRNLMIHVKNYPTRDLKLAAVVFALIIWRQQFYSVQEDMFTDH